MKRFIACVLVLTTVLSLIMVTPAAADNAEYDIKSVEYAAKVLSGLNIYSKSSSTSSRISRIEFITSLCEIIDSKGVLASEEKIAKHITDISDADKVYVELALRKGIIKEPADGKFNPEGTVDIDFAAYAFVAMTGYFQDIQEGVYVNRAQNLGLLNGVKNFDALTYADLVLMLYNMLDTHFLEQVVYGSENKFVVSNETVLEHFFGLKTLDARLVANYYTDLSGTMMLADDYIALQRTKDGIIETFKCNYNYNEDLLGRNLTVFYDIKSKCVIYMVEGKNDKCLAEIEGSDLVKFNKNDRKLYYQKMKNGSRWEETYKSVYVTIPVKVDVIYNGQFTLDHKFVYDILERKTNSLNIGKIAVYDVNGDSKADLLKVEAYQDILVESVDETGKVIFDALSGKRIVLDEEEIDGVVKIKDSFGETSTLSAIKKGDVVSVYSGKGKKTLINVVFYNGTKIEYLVSKHEKDGRHYIKTENVQYMLSAELASSGKITLGREIKLYLDHLGCIVKVAEVDTTYHYIGSVASVNSEDNGFSKGLEIKVFTANGDFVTYKAADKLYADGNKVNSNDWKYVDNGVPVDLVSRLMKGIIQFKVNSKNEINRIYFPSKEHRDGVISYSNGMAKPEVVFENPKGNSSIYKTNGKYFIPYSSKAEALNFVTVGSGAKFMTVPSDNIIYDREKHYNIPKSFKNDDRASVVGYTFSDGSYKSDLVVVVTEGAVSIEKASNYVVKDVYTSWNNEENAAFTTVECMNSSGSVLTFSKEGSDIPQYKLNGTKLNDKISLAVGDVVKIALDTNGDINGICKMYDSEAKTGQMQNETYWYADKRCVYGSIYDIDDNVISYVIGKDITSDNVSNELNVASLNSTKAFIVKSGMNGKVLEQGSVSEAVGYKEDTQKYSKVVLAGAYGEVSLVVVYLAN